MTTIKGYVNHEYLRVAGAFVNQIKQRTYTLMQIESGNKVLDVGCGPGIDTIALSQLVGGTGEVYGVDHDQAMIKEAEQSAEKAGVSAWVHHHHSDAALMPFETGYFDSCRSERLFQHLRNPVKVLDEMARVTKGNGWVVVLDTDWGSGGIDTSEIDIERRLSRFMADHMYHNGYSGRQLYRQLKQQGLVNVSIEVFPIVVTSYAFATQLWDLEKLASAAIANHVVSEAEAEKLQTELKQADAQGLFFGYGCLTLVAGQKAEP